MNRAALLAILLLPLPAWSADTWDPWQKPSPPAAAAAGSLAGATNAIRIAGLVAIRIYQRTLSPALGSGCQFTPSCSAYAFRCIASYGLVNGTWMGAERISRCHGFAALGGYRVSRSGALIDPPEDKRPPLPVLSWLGL